MNIAEILRDVGTQAGDRRAIIDRDGEMSFAQLDRVSARMAAEIRAAGLRPGDRALVVHPISIRLYALLIGLFRLGATALLLDPSAGRAYLDRCCRLAEPRGFVATPRAHLLGLVSRSIRRIPIAIGVGGYAPRATIVGRVHGNARRAHPPAESMEQGERDDRIEACGDDTPALLTFTSGSTGEPKATLRTHGFLLAQQRVLAQTLRLQPGAADLTTLPVFVLSNLASGVTSILPDADLRRPGAIDPAPVLRQIAHHRPASVVASPAFLDRLVSGAAPESFAGVMRIFTGGAPVFPRLLRKVHAVAPQATVTAVYGSTEAEPIAHVDLDAISADDFDRMQAGAGLLAGSPVEAITLRVMPDRWGQSPPSWGLESTSPARFDAEALPAGRIGEIIVSGPHVLRGYLDGAGDSETKVRGADRIWHRTGDAGYLDNRGRLWLMGRCSARIDDAQGTLYPFAVEAAAQAVEGVARAALIARDGERLLAVEIEPATSHAAHDARVRETCNVLRRVLAWASLADIVPVRAIPVDRRHNAKVDYVALRKLLA
jgi:olefin beta-lactone synthetase